MCTRLELKTHRYVTWYIKFTVITPDITSCYIADLDILPFSCVSPQKNMVYLNCTFK